MGRTSNAKDRLVAAMASLVHRRGYLAVGVDDVCKAAGVKKGSFYYFFASKRELMLAALGHHRQMATHVFGVAFGADRPPLKRIERLLEMMATFEATNKVREGSVLGCPFGNLAAEVGGSEPALTKRVDEALCGFSAYIRDALKEAKKKGDLDRNVDVNTAADAVVAYFEGVALLAKTRNDPSLIRRLGPRAVQLAIDPVVPSQRRNQKSKI